MKTKVQCLLGGIFLLAATAATLAVPVTFMVDMSGFGGFTAGDPVDVRGDFNGWSAGDDLVPTANPYILTNTVEIADVAGTVEPYKFTWYGVYELDGLGNRFFTLQGAAQKLPLVYFSDQPLIPRRPIPSPSASAWLSR